MAGDVLRGITPDPYPPDDPAAHPAYPTFIRYPIIPEAALSSEGTFLRASPILYEGVKIEWGLAPEDEERYEWVCISRSGFGVPKLPNEGVHLFMERQGIVLPKTLTDPDVQPGRWAYYGLFARINSVWQRLNTARVLVPIDYEHRDYLWSKLPEFYRHHDDQTWTGTTNSPLRKFLSLIGYELDTLRTLAEGVEHIYQPDLAPQPLLEALGTQNLGADPGGDVGDIRYRRFVARSPHLFGLRGTLRGLEDYIEAVTQYSTEVLPGRNILLTPDNAEAFDSIGHWAPPSASLAVNLASGSTSAVDTVRTYDIRIKRVGADELEPPSVLDREPSLVLGNGVIKVSPRWVPSPGRAVWSDESEMVVVCGAGRRYAQVGADEWAWIEQDPRLYGVPVSPGRLYYLSFFVAREGLMDTFDDAGNVVGSAPLVMDMAGIRFGFGWFNRTDANLPNMDNKAFSDAFGGGLTEYGTRVALTDPPVGSFSGFRRVRYLATSLTEAAPETTADTKEWVQYTTSFVAPEEAATAVPIIQWIGRDFGARYLAAIQVSEDSGVGIEGGYAPDIYLTLGDEDETLDSEYVLGPTP